MFEDWKATCIDSKDWNGTVGVSYEVIARGQQFGFGFYKVKDDKNNIVKVKTTKFTNYTGC